jgi:hypothetical protein
MLPPTWVDSLANHNSKNGRFRSTAMPPLSGGAAASTFIVAVSGDVVGIENP